MYRLFLIIGLLVLLFVLLKSIYRSSKQVGRPAPPPLDGDQMVQDPVCGVFVPRKTAIVQQVGGISNCFCSQECAAKFEEQRTS
jgi:YHS domain-containing protein